MKALVVDAAPARRALLCAQIERLGLTVCAVDSGSAALKRFLAEEPELVVIDTELPDLDGFDLPRRLRALEDPAAWTPMLLVTPSQREDDLARGIAAGADDYLFLPLSEAVLAAKIRSMQRLIQMRYSMQATTRKLDLANRELGRLAAVDGLTGLANRRHFESALAREWRRSMRQGSEVSLIMADVDHFKRFNDRYGHPAGDDMLREVARLLEQAAERGGDLAARYGGEEFALILPETGMTGAARLAERLRQSLEEAAIVHADSPLGHASMSFGVASAVAMPETEPAALLGAADRALYQAKASGRNRVALAPSIESDPTD